MILHLEDWQFYPSAIVQTNTRNTSFLEYVKLLKRMGVKNHQWPLALMNPLLKDVDPFSPDLTAEQVGMIATECKCNYWYYLREVALVPQPGAPEPSHFLANRANMAMYWCFLNNIDFFVIIPRQCGKSVASDVLDNYIINLAGFNTDIALITKDNSLRAKNIKRLKEIRDLLPDYLNFYQNNVDSNNQMNLTCKALKNTYTAYVAQSDVAAADRVGRGATSPIIKVDEIAYDYNIHISLGVALASAGTAREWAEKNNTHYGNMYMTTAGTLDSKSGKFAHDIMMDSYQWRENLLDAGNREAAWKIVESEIDQADISHKHRVAGTFSHRQLGKTDQWLIEKAATSELDEDGIRRDYLNEWTSGSIESPLSKQLNKIIRQSEINQFWSQITSDKYTMDWYIEAHKIQEYLMTRETILSVDPSQMIGSDGNGTVLQGLETMEVLMTSKIVTGVVQDVAHLYAKLLIAFPKITFIIENTVSGQSILDIVAADLIAAGINPFTRIYNDIINRGPAAGSIYEEVMQSIKNNNCTIEFYRKLKGHFGFKTTGQSRPVLYGMVFQRAAKSVGHLVRSKNLIDQILALVKRNGRVDHPIGGHDDLVIAWLLGQWFSTYAENLSVYGIRPGIVQSLVSDEGAVLPEEQIAEQIFKDRMVTRINALKEDLRQTRDPSVADSLILQIKLLSKEIPDVTTRARVNADIDLVIKERRLNKATLAQRMREEEYA